MKQMFKAKVFWLILLFATAVTIFLEIQKSTLYSSQAEILVIPKSEKSAANIEQIMETVQLIPTPLAFYDKLLEKNPDIEDLSEGLANYQRKNFWNETLRIERVRKSMLVRITAQSKNPLQAEFLSQNTARDVAVVASKYFDIKSDLEIRIFDRAITQKKSALDPLKIIFSLAVGFVSGATGFLIFSAWQKINHSFVPPKFARPEFSVSFPYGKPDFLNEEEYVAAEKKLVSEKSVPVPRTDKKTAAPANLPIGEEFVMQAIQAFSHKDEVAEEKKVEEIRAHEATPEEVRTRLELLKGVNQSEKTAKVSTATPEEVKARLNQLLRGEIEN